jgi:uncharacterized protein YqjF (DUF2071 family)
MHRMRPSMLLAGLVPALALTGSTSAVIALFPGASAAGSPVHIRQAGTNGTAPEVLASAHYGAASNASGFSAIVTTRGGTAWALGGTNPGGPSSPVAEQWNGRSFVAARLPGGLSGFLTDASAPGPSDIWASSRYGGYVLHWDGTGWQLSKRWSSGEITGVTATSPHDVWVFGSTVNGLTGTGTWQFNGRSWTEDRAGSAPYVYRASAVSRRDIWAIAIDRGRYFIARYDGRTWRRAPAARVLADVQLSDILAISRNNVWVVGNSESARNRTRLVLAHYNGTRWVRIPTRLRAWAGRLAPGTHGGVLLTVTPARAGSAGMILRAWAGGWGRAIMVRSSLGSGVSDAALDRETKTVLASGAILTRLGGDAVIWALPAGLVHHRHADTT